MTSLRARAVTGGILWAVVVIVLGLASLSSAITTQPTARFIEDLQARHTQALIAVSSNVELPAGFAQAIADPAYDTALSGQYWQLEVDAGPVFASASLDGAQLPRPIGFYEGIRTSKVSGPGNDSLFMLGQWVTQDDGSRVHVQIAASVQSLDRAQDETRRSLLNAFAVIAFVGVLGALAQVAVVLRPLEGLRKEVAMRWEDDEGLSVVNYPVEVAPLVADINSLLTRNREIMTRARRQAADLAHAIKTPSAIMRNELETLQRNGVAVQEATDALDRLDAQLKRSFARIRADAGAGDVGSATALDVALGRMSRAFTALARNAGKTFAADFPPGLRVRMDQADVEEVLGNLLDNAMKWATAHVRLEAAQSASGQIAISIIDDGPGIPAEAREAAVHSGKRLDMSMPGTGLGLAIVSDLMHAYEGQLLLEEDPRLGGLKATVVLPQAARRKERATNA